MSEIRFISLFKFCLSKLSSIEVFLWIDWIVTKNCFILCVLIDRWHHRRQYMLNSAQKFKLIAMFYFWFDPKLKSPVWTYSILLPAFFPWFLIFTIHHNYVLLILDGVVFYWIKAKSIKLIERLRKQSLPFCLRKSIFVKF